MCCLVVSPIPLLLIFLSSVNFPPLIAPEMSRLHFMYLADRTLLLFNMQPLSSSPTPSTTFSFVQKPNPPSHIFSLQILQPIF